MSSLIISVGLKVPARFPHPLLSLLSLLNKDQRD